MNPIIALMALIWLIKGVRLQQKELEDTKRALQDSEKHQAKQVNISAITAIISALNEDVADLTNTRNIWQAKYSSFPKTIESWGMSPDQANCSREIGKCDKDISEKRVEIDGYVTRLRAILDGAP